VRVAKITVASSIPAGYMEYADTKNIFQITRVKINTDTWHTLANTVIGGGGAVPGTYLSEFKKDSTEFVHLSGLAYTEDVGIGAVNHLIGTLPVGYRPATQKTFVVSGDVNATTGVVSFATVVVETDGEVRVKSQDGSFVYILDLSQIPPFEGV
jgi:hypothetical protein